MQFRSLKGLVPYEQAQAIQRESVDARARDEIGDTILFLEHAPVVTRGRGLQFTGQARPKAMPLGELPAGIAYAESERGGDLTFHGPGQLVIYPIVKLGGPSFERDVARFLREFEGALIDVLAGLAIRAQSRANATGVWVGERKLASVGIAVRRWVTWHGMAINVANDLAPFRLISPCGFDPAVMTRLADLTPVPEDWRSWFEPLFMDAFARRARENCLHGREQRA